MERCHWRWRLWGFTYATCIPHFVERVETGCATPPPSARLCRRGPAEHPRQPCLPALDIPRRSVLSFGLEQLLPPLLPTTWKARVAERGAGLSCSWPSYARAQRMAAGNYRSSSRKRITSFFSMVCRSCRWDSSSRMSANSSTSPVNTARHRA